MIYTGEKQQTVAGEVVFSGVGIHSGRTTKLVIRPAEADTGLKFRRVDLPGEPEISVCAENGQESARATTLVKDGTAVFTVEHFLSALHALKVDNAVIEMDGPEPPILDGGSLPIVKSLKEVGFMQQGAERRYVTITEPVTVYGDKDHEQMVIALPADDFRVSFTSVNPHPLVGSQFCDVTVDEASYEKEIAPARTIAYEKEVEALHAAGLGLGGSLENTIVYSDDKWLTPLRFPDELVRHKILDLIGDLRVLGLVKGHFIAVKSSHALNGRLAKKIAAGLNG
ncbi:MAG: UDP-3-O-[Schwartzia sp.]|nr:UDP-3-O-[3-hydroxymyristoyl] N-acetylglucosamine deacetylase [Schwartzia sp. (in: firmicutes)]